MSEHRGIPLEIELTDVPVPPELFTHLMQVVAHSPDAGRALYNVLRIHHPEWQGGGESPAWAPWQNPPPLKAVCYECGAGCDGTPWPCPTIREITDVILPGEPSTD